MKNISLIIIILIAGLFTACEKQSKNISTDLKYSDYVQAYTSGVISTDATIYVHLARPLQNIDVLDKNIFKFSPDVKGETILVGNRILEFRPSEPLKQDTKYTVTFNLEELIETEKGYNKMPFQFSTVKQSFSVHIEGLKNYEGTGYPKMKLEGYVLTADVLSASETEKILAAEYNSKQVNISWNHDADRRKHFFVIDSLVRKKKSPSTLSIKWDGNPIDVDKEGKETIEVPALDNFKIIDARVVQNPQQHILISFSDVLLNPQNLSGLLTLENNPDLRLEIEGNQIKVWPKETLTGERTLIINNGIANANYFKLKDQESFLLQFSSVKPELKLLGKGIIVPQSDRMEFPFEAIGLNAVELRVIQIYKNNVLNFFQDNQYTGSHELRKYGRLIYSGKVELKSPEYKSLQTWNTFKVNLASLFEIEQGAIYRVELRMKKEYSEFKCGEENTELNLNEPDINLNEEYQSTWDNPGWYSNYYYPPGYDWEEKNNPCHISYYNSSRFVARNIFASELGIIAKEGRDHEMVFAVSNIRSAAPESGVDLKLFSFQNQLIESTVTGSNGLAKVDMKKKPFFLLAQKGNQFGYLRLDDGSALSTSNFNVSGREVKEGTKGFIYGERGVWRPGDTLFINFILEKQSTELPDRYPVAFNLINPNGQTVERQVQTENKNGFYKFQPITASNAPTGNWKVEVKVGNVIFSKRLKIETVKPNRLKIELDLPDRPITSSDTKIPISSSWLHGTPGKSLKTKVDVLFVKDNTKFDGYEDYSFTDPASEFTPHEQTVYEGTLDENGKSSVPLNFSSIKNAPGLLKVWFTSKVFEQGGDFSINVKKAQYAPFESYVGVKMPESENGWYKTDTDYSPEIVLVDANGKPISGNNLQARLYKINWRWWWESGSENLAHYVSGRYSEPVAGWRIRNAKHRNRLRLNVKYRSWKDNGRYLLWIKDLDSGHATATTFYMSKWGSWRSEGSAEGATMLTLKTDKEKYETGEDIKITLPSSKAGKALVSIENGTEISDIFWIETKEKQTTFTITAKPEMAPNFYINVSLLQPYGQTENDAPLRLYGIAPVLVENPETILNPEINAPEEIEPESEYSLEIKEANGKGMTYTLAIVDEGLLGLTNYVTPNPHHSFYAREAHGVKTWDLYDYVAGAYGAALEKAFAVGGDGDLENAGKKEVNRFKPVVMFAGPFSLEKGKRNRHTFKMPNYVGAVRMMIIAGNDGAYGKKELTVPVRKGLMLLATLPRVLAPNESVKLPVNVFAMKEQVKDVKIKVKANELLDVNLSEQTISFEKPGEKMAYFDVKVNARTGVAKVKIEAESGKEKASYEVELLVRNPNSPVTVDESAIVDGGNKWNTTLNLPGEVGSNDAWIEISGFPALNLSKHLDYLIRYPHGCVEQIVSATMPQLFLGNLIELNAEQKLEIEDHVRSTLRKLQDYQIQEGGLAYWPGGVYTNKWGTNYAGHFMLLAESGGYSLPVGLKEKWLTFQKREALNWRPDDSNSDYYQRRNKYLSQAYRLYTLALAGSPDLGAMNRLRERTKKSVETTWRLASAYVLAGQPEAGMQMISGISTEIKEYNEFSGTFGSGLRDKAMVLESLILLEKKEEAFNMLKDISEIVRKREWLSTQAAAWCLSSASMFAKEYFGKDSDTNFEITVNGETKEMRTSIPLVKIPVSLKSNENIDLEFLNKGENPTFVSLVAKGVPTGIDPASDENNLVLHVKYLDSAGDEINPEKIRQGEDFRMEVRVKHPGLKSNYEEMVLSTVFPSGWEIINRRLNDIPANEESGFQYQDIRDDRIYTYFDLDMNQQKTFVFNLNATYKGKYYMPPVSCEAMYDFSVRAKKPGKIVEVQ